MRRTISRPAPSPVPKTPPCVSSIKSGSVSPPPPTGKLWISWQPTSSSQRLMATNRCSLFPIQNRQSQSRPMTKPSLALSKESETLDFDVPGELRFIRNSSIFGKMSTSVRQANETRARRTLVCLSQRGVDSNTIPSMGTNDLILFPKTKTTFPGGFQ